MLTPPLEPMNLLKNRLNLILSSTKILILLLMTQQPTITTGQMDRIVAILSLTDLQLRSMPLQVAILPWVTSLVTTRNE
uniref:Uncharacterized protein n=1 Tax=Helianthus annuus TaxID=4232 RepID=A0A251S5K9_HELAN